jgi:hypothetical protein
MRLFFITSLSTIVIVLMLTACGHKDAPLTKDRLSPKLLKVAALNSTQIQFTFSEDLDTLNLKPENFLIVHNEDTLSLTILYPSLSPAEIIAISEPQRDVIYTVTGYVYDPAENKGNFEKPFQGSTVPDTIAPWLVSYSHGIKSKKLALQFSEAMDTSFFSYYMVPDRKMTHKWRDYRTCSVVPDSVDTLSADTTYYFMLFNGAHDISGNTLPVFITSITPDTVLPNIELTGSVTFNDTLVTTGIVVLSTTFPCGVVSIDGGKFRFQVRDSTAYTATIVCDQLSAQQTIVPDSNNVIVLERKELDLDSILR